jgi:hypothetical protein
MARSIAALPSLLATLVTEQPIKRPALRPNAGQAASNAA